MVKSSPKTPSLFEKKTNRMATYFGNHYEILDDNLDIAKQVMLGTWKNGEGPGSKTFVWDNQDGTYSSQEVNTYEGRIKVVSDLLGLNEKADYQILERLVDSQTYLTSTKSRAKNAAGRTRAEVVKDYLHGSIDAAERSQKQYAGLEESLSKSEKRAKSAEDTMAYLKHDREQADAKAEKKAKVVNEVSKNRDARIKELKGQKKDLRDDLGKAYLAHDSLEDYTASVEQERDVGRNVVESQRKYIETTYRKIAKDRKKQKLKTFLWSTGAAAVATGLTLLLSGCDNKKDKELVMPEPTPLAGVTYDSQTIEMDSNTNVNEGVVVKDIDFTGVSLKDAEPGLGEPIYDSFSVTNDTHIITTKTVTQKGPNGEITTKTVDKKLKPVSKNKKVTQKKPQPSLEEQLAQTPGRSFGSTNVSGNRTATSDNGNITYSDNLEDTPYSSGFVYVDHKNARDAQITNGNINANPILTGKSVWNHLNIWGDQLADFEDIGWGKEANKARGGRFVNNMKAIGDILPGVNNNEVNAQKKEDNNWLQRGIQKVYHAGQGIVGGTLNGLGFVDGGIVTDKVVNDVAGGAIVHGIVNPAVDVGNLIVSVPGAGAQTVEGWIADNDGKFSRKAYEGITSLLRFGGNVILHEAPIDGRYARIVTQDGEVIYLDKGQIGALAESFTAAGIDATAAYYSYDSLKNNGGNNPTPNPVDGLTGGDITGGPNGGAL